MSGVNSDMSLQTPVGVTIGAAVSTCVISLITFEVISLVRLQTWFEPSHCWSCDGFINSKRRLLSLPYLDHTCIAFDVMSYADSILDDSQPSSGSLPKLYKHCYLDLVFFGSSDLQFLLRPVVAARYSIAQSTLHVPAATEEESVEMMSESLDT